jgi:hypothetical protein
VQFFFAGLIYVIGVDLLTFLADFFITLRQSGLVAVIKLRIWLIILISEGAKKKLCSNMKFKVSLGYLFSLAPLT